jgi:phosphohistidine phosphatase
MRLIVLRHAKANHPADFGDHDRPLSEQGRRACREIGWYIRDGGLVPDMAIVSTARRAQETWHLVRSASDVDVVWRSDHRVYEASPATLLAVIRETAAEIRSLLVVGHNPGLRDLAISLISTAEPSALAGPDNKLPTAGLVAIEFKCQNWRDVSLGSGEVEHFASPKSLIR